MSTLAETFPSKKVGCRFEGSMIGIRLWAERRTPASFRCWCCTAGQARRMITWSRLGRSQGQGGR